MAAKYPTTPVVDISRHISIPELERGLEEITLQVADKKRHLSDTFRQIHLEVSEREVALVAELDAIPAVIAARIEERKASLEQLTRNRDDTERELHANRLNALLQKHLDDIKTEMDRILSEKIEFPHISIHCEKGTVQTILKEKYFIVKTHDPYIARTLPIWRTDNGEGQLFYPGSLCIDPNSQLIYVGDFVAGQIQVFTSEGKHSSTLQNEQISGCKSMKIHRDHIYLSTGIGKYNHFLKMNKKGETIKRIPTDKQIQRIAMEDSKLYTCDFMSLTISVYDLNLKHLKGILLKAISSSTSLVVFPKDIIVKNQIMYVLFSYYTKRYHLDPIQLFQLDGTLIRSLVAGKHIRNYDFFCLDSYQNILVSDNRANSIRIFSPEGLLIQTIGKEEETTEGQFCRPSGIAVDSKGRIIVVDKNSLQAF